MLRLTVLAALLAAAPFAVAPGGPAVAVVETCHGQEATIVGGPRDDQLLGTDGPDVIVTNGTPDVRAGDGDDVICVTGNNAEVRAGRGDDDVDASEAPFLWAELGPGADTYQGSSGPDTVWAGDRRKKLVDARDAERDVISTARGYDTVTAGEADSPFQDQIDTGAGNDRLTIGATIGDETATIALGRGSDRLGFRWPAGTGGSWVIDNEIGSVTRDGTVQYSWSDAESFDLPDLRDHPVAFRGGDSGETITAGYFRDIALGRGADVLQLRPAPFRSEIDTSGRVEGGAGRDRLVVNTFDDAFIDLGGVARFAEFNLGDVRLAAVENLTLYGGTGTITIRGSAAANSIRSEGCRQTADGGAGADHIVSSAVECLGGERSIFRGGPGNDLLRGAGTPDRLSGGPGADELVGREGRDVANGGPGADRCSAEVRRSCERS